MRRSLETLHYRNVDASASFGNEMAYSAPMHKKLLDIHATLQSEASSMLKETAECSTRRGLLVPEGTLCVETATSDPLRQDVEKVSRMLLPDWLSAIIATHACGRVA